MKCLWKSFPYQSVVFPRLSAAPSPLLAAAAEAKLFVKGEGIVMWKCVAEARRVDTAKLWGNIELQGAVGAVCRPVDEAA